MKSKKRKMTKTIAAIILAVLTMVCSLPAMMLPAMAEGQILHVEFYDWNGTEYEERAIFRRSVLEGQSVENPGTIQYKGGDSVEPPVEFVGWFAKKPTKSDIQDPTKQYDFTSSVYENLKLYAGYKVTDPLTVTFDFDVYKSNMPKFNVEVDEDTGNYTITNVETGGRDVDNKPVDQAEAIIQAKYIDYGDQYIIQDEEVQLRKFKVTPVNATTYKVYDNEADELVVQGDETAINTKLLEEYDDAGYEFVTTPSPMVVEREFIIDEDWNVSVTANASDASKYDATITDGVQGYTAEAEVNPPTAVSAALAQLNLDKSTTYEWKHSGGEFYIGTTYTYIPSIPLNAKKIAYKLGYMETIGSENAPSPPQYSEDGYEFAGWYAKGDKKWDLDNDKVMYEDMTLKARYAEKPVTVTFKMTTYKTVSSNGEVTTIDSFPTVGTVSVSKGAKIPQDNVPTAADVPEPEGYTIEKDTHGNIKWYDGSGNPWDFETGRVYGNKTLYTFPKPKKYDITLNVCYDGMAKETRTVRTEYAEPFTNGKFVDEHGEEYSSYIPHWWTPPTSGDITYEETPGWYTDTYYHTEIPEDFPVTMDRTLYHIYESYYTVSFNVEGADNADNPAFRAKKVMLGKSVSMPNVEPRKQNLSFLRWENEDGGYFNFGQPITDNTDAIAAFIASVTFHDIDPETGDIHLMKKDVREDHPILEVSVDDRPGYTLLGWWTGWDEDKKEVTGRKWNFDDDVQENMPLYANWYKNPAATYTVTFNADGGTPVPAPQTELELGAKVTKPTDPTKAGYTFLGWKNGDAIWDFANNTITGDMTLTASWISDVTTTHTVTFNADGGTPVPAPQTIADGGLATKPVDPSKTGYTFVSWLGPDGAEWNFTANTVRADTTLTAKYQENGGGGGGDKDYYTVTFDTNGGKPKSDTQVVEKNGKIEEPAEPRLGDYIFGGWYYNSEEWDFMFDKVTSDMTLTAVWIPVTYRVTFDANGGSPTPSAQVVERGKYAYEPSAPTKNHAELEGWYRGNTKWDFYNDVVTSNVTLKAKWKSQYKVEISNGEYVISTTYVNDGDTVAEPDTPKKDGSKFKGWYVKVKDGKILSGKTDSGSWEEFNFSTQIHQNTYIKARWDTDSDSKSSSSSSSNGGSSSSSIWGGNVVNGANGGAGGVVGGRYSVSSNGYIQTGDAARFAVWIIVGVLCLMISIGSIKAYKNEKDKIN